MGDLFGSYGRRIREPGSFHLGPAWDEMFESGGDAEFLVLDRLFSRSIYFSLGTAENCLAELGPRAGRVGVDDVARRHLGQARAQLEFTSVADLVNDLPGRLAYVQKRCSDASAAISERYFRPAAVVEWSA